MLKKLVLRRYALTSRHCVSCWEESAFPLNHSENAQEMVA
jgi:hypothetical protein